MKIEPHKHDQDWIKQVIFSLPIGRRDQAMQGYKAIFEAAYNDEPVDHKKMNAARKAANTRLRDFAKRIKKGV